MATSMTTKAIIVAVLLVVPAAIGYALFEARTPQRANVQSDVQAAHAPAAGTRRITPALFAPWPLVVQEAELRCHVVRGVSAPTVVTTAGEFALTGQAQAAGFPPLEGVWLDDVNNPGAKVSIGPMIAAARALCPTKY